MELHEEKVKCKFNELQRKKWNKLKMTPESRFWKQKYSFYITCHFPDVNEILSNSNTG